MARNVSNSMRRYLLHGVPFPDDGYAHGGFVFDTPEDKRKWENATLTRSADADWDGYDRPVDVPNVLTGAVLCEPMDPARKEFRPECG
jgi:hypothetical protein